MNVIKQDCYRLLQEVVLARDILCRAPGCGGELATAAHHIFGRGNLATAFNPLYAIGLCVNCHIPWAHAEPEQFREWAIYLIGEEEYYAALRLSNTVVKYQDLKQIRDKLRAELLTYTERK